MSNTSRAKKLIILLVILVVVVLGGYLGYMQYNEVMAKGDQLEKVEAELEMEKEDLAALKELDKKIKSMEKELVVARSVIPAQKSVPDLLVNLEAIASYSELTFNSVSFSETRNLKTGKKDEEADKAPKDLKELSVTVSVIGNYLNVKRYVDSLEKNLRIIDVSSISMSEGGLYDIKMSAYFVD